MATVHTLVQMITNLTALAPVLSPWEKCALKIVIQDQPVSVSFICKSGQRCPVNSFYKELNIPSQTIFDLNTNELPFFHENDMVFIFDDNVVTWNDQTVSKYRLWGKNNFKLVVVANRKNLDHDLRSMEDLFAAMWLSGIVRCAVLLVDDTSTQIYTYFPFKSEKSCEDTSPVLIGECSEGIGKAFDLEYKIFNRNQCSIRVATMQGIPTVQNGTIGHEIMNAILIRETANKMNAMIKSVIPDTGLLGETCGPEERTGARGIVLNGSADLVLGRFVSESCSTLETVGVGHVVCMSWCTPVFSASDYVYLFLLRQLTPEVWAAVVVSVLVVSVSVFFLCAASLEDWTASDVFYLALAIYAQPPPAVPTTAPARMVVIVWLWACLIIRAAYEGEMKSQSAAALDIHIIYDLEELSHTDIKLCATGPNVEIIQQTNHPIMRRLAKQAEVCRGSLRDNAVKAARKKDRGVLMGIEMCLSIASELRKDGGFLYPKTGGCFRTYEVSPFAVLRGSPYKSRWRLLALRCFETGLITKWFVLNKPQIYSGGPVAFSLNHLFPAMFVLGVGYLGGFLLFIGEKSYYKWSQRRKPDSKP